MGIRMGGSSEDVASLQGEVCPRLQWMSGVLSDSGSLGHSKVVRNRLLPLLIVIIAIGCGQHYERLDTDTRTGEQSSPRFVYGVNGTVIDKQTNIAWDAIRCYKSEYDGAIACCGGIENRPSNQRGNGVWHLPTIDELRSLLEGCPSAELGGECDSLLQCGGCYEGCSGCPIGMGDGPDGSYTDGILGNSNGWYWSSTICQSAECMHSNGPRAYALEFGYARVWALSVTNKNRALCVTSIE